jgi:hypothetical protein
MGRETAQWVRHYVSKLNVESVWLRSSCTGTMVKRAKPRVWTLKSSKSRPIAALFIGLFGPLCAQQGVELDLISNLNFPTELVMFRSKGGNFLCEEQNSCQSPEFGTTTSHERGP